MGEPVEKFRLTKEQVAWQRQYAKVLKTQRLVQGKLHEQMAGARTLRDLAGGVQRQMVRMLKEAPPEVVKSLDGQGAS